MKQPDAVRIHLPGGWNIPPLGVHQYLALMIVAVSLWALGSIWMGLQLVEDWMGGWQQQMVLHVYVPQEEKAALNDLQAELKQVDGVTAVQGVPHEDAARWMQQWLGQSGVSSATLAKHLPETLVLSLQYNEHTPFVADDVRELAQRIGGSINEDEVHMLGMRKVLDKAVYLAWFVSLLLGLAMALIVSNTLRMILLARADEIHLMRLMGAKEWFVRMPFLLEGALLGAVAGVLAWLWLWPWRWGLQTWLDAASLPLHIAWLLLPLLLGGAVLGALGAGIATTKLAAPDNTQA